MTYRFFVAKMHYSLRKYIFRCKVNANVHFSLLKEPGYCVDSSMAYGANGTYVPRVLARKREQAKSQKNTALPSENFLRKC